MCFLGNSQDITVASLAIPLLFLPAISILKQIPCNCLPVEANCKTNAMISMEKLGDSLPSLRCLPHREPSPGRRILLSPHSEEISPQDSSHLPSLHNDDEDEVGDDSRQYNPRRPHGLDPENG